MNLMCIFFHALYLLEFGTSVRLGGGLPLQTTWLPLGETRIRQRMHAYWHDTKTFYHLPLQILGGD